MRCRSSISGRVSLLAVFVLFLVCTPAVGRTPVAPKPQTTVKDFESIKKYALIVGINTYSGKNIPPLRYAVRDAEELYKVVIDPRRGGFPLESVALLTDSSGTPPTAANIGRSLTKIRTSAREEDLVLVFFSGHGYEEAGRAYLLPQGADLDALDFTAIERDAFVREIDKIVANRVIVILDACHAGGISRGGKGAGRDAALSDRYYGQFTGSRGRAFIASCGGGQLSWEDEEAGHGVFTSSLVRGLSGGADRLPEDGVVTLVELQRFLESDVTDWAKRHGKTQQPQVNLESAYGDMPIGLNMDYLDSTAKQAEARRGDAEELKVGLVSMVDLEADEVAKAVALLDSLSEGTELTSDEQQMIVLIRKLVDGSIDVATYRTGVRGLSVTVVIRNQQMIPARRFWFATVGAGGFSQAGEKFTSGIRVAPLIRFGYTVGRWGLQADYLLASGELKDSPWMKDFEAHLITLGPRLDVELSKRVLSYFQLGVGGYVGPDIRNDRVNVAVSVGTGLELGLNSWLAADLSAYWVLSNAALIDPSEPELEQSLYVGLGLGFAPARSSLQ
jgi:hypothetical protein